MPTRYQRQDTLEREHDTWDFATTSMLAQRSIIDTTAVVIHKEPESVPLVIMSPRSLVMDRIVADMPHPSPWRRSRVWLAAAIIVGVLGSIVSYPGTIAIAADSTSARLVPGMTATITLTTQEVVGVALVPNAARAQLVTNTAVQNALAAAQNLRASQPDLTAGTASFVLHYRQGRLTAIPVVIDITDGMNTVILAGLSNNQAIVVGDNQTVTATNATIDK